MDKSLKTILDIIPQDLSEYFKDNTVTEIRLRQNHNIILNTVLNQIEIADSTMTKSQVENILMALCDYTLSSREKEISQGYITIDGGHRIGIGGKFFHSDKGVFLSQIYSLNIRISNPVSMQIDERYMDFKKGLLIAGPPHSGKTTFLRNIIDSLYGNVVVCDERNELYMGDSCCDYISGIAKHIAIEQATRSLNPDYIICDELGTEFETQQILSCINTGVKIVATVHSDNLDNLKLKPNIKKLMNADVFDKFILLNDKKGFFSVKEVRDV